MEWHIGKECWNRDEMNVNVEKVGGANVDNSETLNQLKNYLAPVIFGAFLIRNYYS